MEKIIRELLSEKRYNHSMAVAELARDLAHRLGEDPEKACLAGVVHDIAKEESHTRLLEICEKNGISLTSVEKANPSLLHAPAGAAMLPDYGINDLEIQNAVRYHTVARADMTNLEKIIYLADMIEPSRDYKEVNELRQLARTDFNEAFRRALKYSIIWNLEKGRLIHEGTLQAWNSLLLKGETL